MKKLFLAVLAMTMLNISFAQTHPKKAKADTTQATTSSTSVVLKKDGTPDRRYKNAPKGPLKKDGTPDKRYKANKSK